MSGMNNSRNHSSSSSMSYETQCNTQLDAVYVLKNIKAALNIKRIGPVWVLQRK